MFSHLDRLIPRKGAGERRTSVWLNGHMITDAQLFHVAVWQAASAPSDLEANLRALDAAAGRTSADGIELLIMPEMYLTGYSIGEDVARLAAENPLEQVREIARRHSIAILAAGPEELTENANTDLANPAIANSAWLIDDAGEVLAKHRKIQLYGDLDRDHFVAGDTPVTMATYRGINIAVLICYDVEYPETVRAAALAGADLVAVPTANMEPFSFVNEHLIRVRAWENSVYVAYANQVGPDGDYTYVGRSVIADPLGEHLAMASAKDEELITATIDPGLLAQAREMNPYVAQVRRDVFCGVSNTASRGGE